MMKVVAAIYQESDGWHFEWRRILPSGEKEKWFYPNGDDQVEEFEEILIKLHEHIREKLPVPSLQGDENYDEVGSPTLKVWWDKQKPGKTVE